MVDWLLSTIRDPLDPSGQFWTISNKKMIFCCKAPPKLSKTVWNVDMPAIIDHYWSKMDHFWAIPTLVMNGGPKCKKGSSPGLLSVACLKYPKTSHLKHKYGPNL